MYYFQFDKFINYVIIKLSFLNGCLMKLSFFILLIVIAQTGMGRHTVLVPARINLAMAQHLFDEPDVKLNYHHLYELSLIKKGKKGVGKFLLYGFHHDYLRIFESKGLLYYHDVTEGPAGSFSARVIINGKDHGLKSFFPPHWSHEKVIETIKNICRDRYRSALNNEMKDRDIFTAKSSEGLTVKIVFDLKKSQVITAYPIIENS
jgi:hypothetical protein